MKITPKQYAVALLESIQGLSRNHTEGVITRFVNLLHSRGMLHLGGKIIRELETYAEKKEGDPIHVITKTEPNTHLFQSLKKIFGSERTIIETIDPNMIGGLRIHVGDTILDASLKTQLHHFRKQFSSGTK